MYSQSQTHTFCKHQNGQSWWITPPYHPSSGRSKHRDTVVVFICQVTVAGLWFPPAAALQKIMVSKEKYPKVVRKPLDLIYTCANTEYWILLPPSPGVPFLKNHLQGVVISLACRSFFSISETDYTKGNVGQSCLKQRKETPITFEHLIYGESWCDCYNLTCKREGHSTCNVTSSYTKYILSWHML